MREKIIELFYENNVWCDQKIEGLADDVMDIITKTAERRLIMRDYYMPETPITDAMVVTNADRIRAMSDEELAKNLVYEMCNYCYEHRTEKCYRKCADNMLEWLKQPAEGE